MVKGAAPLTSFALEFYRRTDQMLNSHDVFCFVSFALKKLDGRAETATGRGV